MLASLPDNLHPSPSLNPPMHETSSHGNFSNYRALTGPRDIKGLSGYFQWKNTVKLLSMQYYFGFGFNDRILPRITTAPPNM